MTPAYEIVSAQPITPGIYACVAPLAWGAGSVGPLPNRVDRSLPHGAVYLQLLPEAPDA